MTTKMRLLGVFFLGVILGYSVMNRMIPIRSVPGSMDRQEAQRRQTTPSQSADQANRDGLHLPQSATQRQGRWSTRIQTGYTVVRQSQGWIESLRAKASKSFDRASGEALPADQFDPKDRRQVQARALEIVTDLADQLGVDPRVLGDAQITPGNYSAQVYFKEKINGFEVEPLGNLTLDLGKQGELLGLYSSWVHLSPPTGGYELSQRRAQSYLENLNLGAKDPHSRTPDSQGVISGRSLMWVNEQSLRPAYEFYAQGHQVIIDAQSGRVLSKRDRRQF